MGDRHQFRAKWHDYECGIYFVTVCTDSHRHYFGNIGSDGNMHLSAIGKIMERHVKELSLHFNFVEVWNYVVMPNHVHLIVVIEKPVGTLFKASADKQALNPLEPNLGCLRNSAHGSGCENFHYNSPLSVVVRCLKGGITRWANKLGLLFKWQSRYHEHIIRSHQAFDKIMNYIDTNVENWCHDCFNDS